MRNIFLLFCFLMMLPSHIMAQNSKKSLSDDSAWYFRERIMDEVARQNGEEAFALMCKKYKFPKKNYMKLKHFYMLRDQEKIMANKLELSCADRLHYKAFIDSIYCDSIYKYLIPWNQISGENISLALKYSKRLDFDEAQNDYLMFRAIDMARRLAKNPKLNVWDEEFDVLKKTLTRKQLRNLMILKHRESINAEMEKIWMQLENAGLTNDVDSAKEYYKARMFLVHKCYINDVFRHKSSERRANLEELKKERPLLIKMYEALLLRKKDENVSEDYHEYVW